MMSGNGIFDRTINWNILRSPGGSRWIGTVLLVIFGIAARPLTGQETSDTIQLSPETLIGSPAAARLLPASGVYLDNETLGRQVSADINRVLRQVPGVYVREEDGMGLFPNISLRGATTERSKAVTLMEDGIPSSPAPYSAPSAYYSPNIARMHGLEVVKGTTQVNLGPHTTGGAVNYLSTPFPFENQTFVKLMYGSHNEAIAHIWHGDVMESETAGKTGFLLEGFYHRTDGFKRIDPAPDFTDADHTGFQRVEPMIKAFWELPTETFHRFEVKYGYTDLGADETYLGLSNSDFARDPYRRYAASRFDRIETMNHRASLRHIMEPRANLRLTTVGYWQDFARNWAKLHQLRNPSVGLSTALRDEIPNGGLAILQGRAPGVLRVRNNNREYRIYGVQTTAAIDFQGNVVDHLWETGLRYHFDEVDRFQWDVDYVQEENGTIADRTVGAMGAAGDRLQQSRAWAWHTRDKISWNRWTATPGIRLEFIDQEYEQDRRRADGGGNPAGGEGDLSVIGGGATLAYRIDDRWNAFAGIHRGFSLPGPRSSIRNRLDEETSLGIELGSKFWDAVRGIKAEAVWFHTRLEDLIVGGNLGGGGAPVTENVGAIDSMGLELTLGYDPGRAQEWLVQTPLSVALTLTDATLNGPARNTDPESLFEGGEDGAKVPYIPDYQVHAEVGLEYERAGAYLSMTYVPATFSSASNTRENVRTDSAGNQIPDARVGMTSSFFVADFSVRYRFRESAFLFAGIRNLFDREYIASRHPHGPRPGAPRLFHVGMETYF